MTGLRGGLIAAALSSSPGTAMMNTVRAGMSIGTRREPESLRESG